ncbi:MAG TPA: diacylglycerol kinase family protein [Steroidobacteraceae bacterium]|nr:diacylglycerol kinase family protein [Steroidobacteraceae bacterium]
MPQSPPSLPTRSTPFLIVMNARAGSGDAREAHQQMQTIFQEAGQAHEFLLVDRPDNIPKVSEQAVAKAKASGGAVVAAGGDGTINALAHAVLPHELPFGIVPQGTFNYSSRAHGIPLETEAAARALLQPKIKPIQVGVVNERIFLVNASLGLYPQLLQDREEFKKEHGRTRANAFFAGLRSLMQDHRQLSLEIEHDKERELVRTPTLFIGNNQMQLERVGLPEADDVQQRRLAAVIVRAQRPRSLLWLALRGALGQLGDARNVRDFSFRTMTVNPWLGGSGRQIKMAIDGEVLHMRPPLKFSVAPQRLWLLTPAEAEA